MTEILGFVGRILKRIAALQGDDVARGTDHQLGFEWQSTQDFRAQGCRADILADNKCSRRADVDHPKVRQLFGKNARLKSLMTADVDRPEKYDRGHELKMKQPMTGLKKGFRSAASCG
jgi:hypothetical protein